jgi:hypothetical protein
MISLTNHASEGEQWGRDQIYPDIDSPGRRPPDQPLGKLTTKSSYLLVTKSSCRDMDRSLGPSAQTGWLVTFKGKAMILDPSDWRNA